MAAWTDEPSTSIDVKLEATAAQPSDRPCEGTVFRTCPLCEAGCGLEITVRDAPSNPSAVVRIRGDRADVFSHGYICPKGSTLKQLHEDPDRFRSPMLKRDGVHVAVSWDESWEAVHAGLNGVIDRHGRSSLASYLGNPGAHSMSALLYNRPLRQAFGSHNRFSASTVDQMPKQCANVAESSSSSILGVREPQSLPTNGSPSAWRRRRIFLGITNTLFIEGLVDPGGHVAAFLNGLDDIRSAVQPFTPEFVDRWCGIDAATIRRISRELAGAPTAAVYGRIGTTTTKFATTTSWLIDVVNVLTGNLDRAGGVMFCRPVTGVRRHVALAAPVQHSASAGVTAGSAACRRSWANISSPCSPRRSPRQATDT